jgi:PAS domain S-box-containing protein
MREEEMLPASFEGDEPAATINRVLADRRELALVALERTRMPIVITDPKAPNGPIVLANKAFLHLTGYRADEVIGRNCRFLQGPETAASDVAAIREGLASHNDVAVELLNYRKDGSTFWNQLGISPIFDKTGQLLYYFASQRDVTARRRAEEIERAERMLLMEVDHRAMNALALVQSFVRLGPTDDAAAYAASIQQRVDALARAHRLLAHNGWSSAALADLIVMETPEDVASRVAAAGPSLALASRIVQPIALALHELMANALAHGALARSEGLVDITWSVEAGRTALRWRERGRLLHGNHPAEGLGLGLVRGVIERQLCGEVRLDWTEGGLDICLYFAPEGPRRALKDDGRPRFRAARSTTAALIKRSGVYTDTDKM